MKRFLLPISCSVCGGEGGVSMGDVADAWQYGARHRAPEVCAENLRREARRLKCERAALERERAKGDATTNRSVATEGGA